MNDQAKNLRKMLDMANDTEVNKKDTRVISVISGKGGVGKSNFALNFSIALSQLGKKVVLFDLDIGMANIDILMGTSTQYNVVDMLDHGLSIWDILQEGPEGLQYVTGGRGFSNIFHLNHSKLTRFLNQLDSLNGFVDYIIFDMGAGVTSDSLQFILSSHENILLTTPETTAMTDAYAMIKYVHARDNEMPCTVVVNRIRTKNEGKNTLEKISQVVKKFLKKDIDMLGFIPYDEKVLRSVNAQTPLVLFDPKAKSSRAIHQMASQYVGNEHVTETTFHTFISKFRFFASKK